MQADNAIYTPTPKTINVVVCTDSCGEIRVDSGPAHLVVKPTDEDVRHETATVVARGNLLGNGRERWFHVELADGTRHMVIGEGS